jgi:WD40 repeat protein
MASVAGFVWDRKQIEESRLHNIAISQEQALDANRELAHNPAKALQLAVASLQAASTREATLVTHKAIDANIETLDLVSDAPVLQAAFNKDRIVSVHNDGSVRLWDVHERSASILLHPSGVAPTAAAFPSDGGRVALLYEGKLGEVYNLGKPDVVVRLAGSDAEYIYEAAFSHDGHYIIGGIRGGGLRLWDASTGALVIHLNTGGPLSSIAVGDGARTIVGIDNSGLGPRVRAWRTDDAWAFKEVALRCEATGTLPLGKRFIMTPDHKVLIALCGTDGGAPPSKARLVAYDIPTLKGLHAIDEVDPSQIFDITPDGKRVLLGTERDLVEWSLETTALTELFRSAPDQAVYALDGLDVLVADKKHMLHDWSPTTKEELGVYAQREALVDVTAAPGGRWLVARSYKHSHTLHVLGILREDGARFGPHGFLASQAAFSADGQYVLSGGGDGFVFVWDSETGIDRTVFGKHSRWVHSISLSPDGRRVATTGEGDIALWRIEDGRSVFAGSTGNTITHAAFTPDGSRLVAGSFHTLYVFSTLDGSLDRKMQVEGVIGGIEVDRDSKRALVLMPVWTEAQIWNVINGKKLLSLRSDALKHARFSPTGDGIAAASGHLVNVWTREGVLNCVFAEHDGEVESVDYLPDGISVVTTSQDTTVRKFKAGNCKQIWTWPGGAPVNTAAVSHDGRLVAAATENGVIHVLDAQTGEEVSTIDRHKGEVFDLRFSQDGRRLVSAGIDRWVRTHIVQNDDLLAAAKRWNRARIFSSGRPLPPDAAQLVGTYELDRDIVAQHRVEAEIGRDPAVRRDPLAMAELRRQASEKAKELWISLSLRQDGWFVMRARITPKSESKAAGIWTASPNAVEILVVETENGYSSNEKVTQLLRNPDHLVWSADGELPLRKGARTANEDTDLDGDAR